MPLCGKIDGTGDVERIGPPLTDTLPHWRRHGVASKESNRKKSAEWRARNPDYHRKWKAANPEKVKSYAAGWRSRNPDYQRTINDRRMVHRSRYRAKRDGLPFDITVESLSIPEVCPLCACQMELGDDRPTKRSPSIDKIIPSLGYTTDNAWVICSGCNQTKGDASPDFMVRVLSEIQRRGMLTEEVTQNLKAIVGGDRSGT